MMERLENWKEVTKGLFHYVCGANVCYELHILHGATFSTNLNILILNF